MSAMEPFELQLQRERVARTQVEALLESTRLQLIEMEYALRKAREDATRCLTEPGVKPAVAAPAAGRASPMSSTMVSPPSSPEVVAPTPASRPLGTPKPRIRRAAPRPAATSLVEAARAAEAIEKAARVDAGGAVAAAPVSGMMTPARAADPLISTLDLYEDDNRAVVTDFIQHLQTRIGKMQACYGSANFTELKWHVTWIRENAAAAGFAVLTLPATDLEMAIDTDAKDQIPACMDHVINQAERVSVERVRR
jgi:hypothetical protein